jgi:hypothetical protein
MAVPAPIVPKKNKAGPIPLEEQINRSIRRTLEEKIRQRAYAIYLSHGGRDRSDIDDWLQAEQEILSEQEI